MAVSLRSGRRLVTPPGEVAEGSGHAPQLPHRWVLRYVISARLYGPSQARRDDAAAPHRASKRAAAGGIPIDPGRLARADTSRMSCHDLLKYMGMGAGAADLAGILGACGVKGTAATSGELRRQAALRPEHHQSRHSRRSRLGRVTA